MCPPALAWSSQHPRPITASDLPGLPHEQHPRPITASDIPGPSLRVTAGPVLRVAPPALYCEESPDTHLAADARLSAAAAVAADVVAVVAAT